MNMRLTLSLVVVSALAAGVASAQQTERVQRRIAIGANGRFTIDNIAGDISISTGSGTDVVIDAMKRTRGNARDLASVTIDFSSRAGAVDVKTTHSGRNDQVSVDYMVVVPASTAVDAKSISGSLKVIGVQGAVRAETISGGVSTSGTPRLEMAKSISGDVEVVDITGDGGLNVGSISGNVRGRNLKVRSLDASTVSGNLVFIDAACERMDAHSTSGNIEYAGTLAKAGRYEAASHSGSIHFTVPESPGFRLTANTFSGSIRSALRVSGDVRRNRRGPGQEALDGTSGDGSATLALHSFSGDIIITKR